MIDDVTPIPFLEARKHQPLLLWIRVRLFVSLSVGGPDELRVCEDFTGAFVVAAIAFISSSAVFFLCLLSLRCEEKGGLLGRAVTDGSRCWGMCP